MGGQQPVSNKGRHLAESGSCGKDQGNISVKEIAEMQRLFDEKAPYYYDEKIDGEYTGK